MDTAGALRDAAGAVRAAVAGMAGTPEAAGEHGTGAGGDVSRTIDVAAEAAAIASLERSGLGCTVLAEERGRVEIPGGPGGYVVMDAVDGSANAVRGAPFFCCSLAYASGDSLGSVESAVVADLAGGAEYWAARGRGAFAGGSPARVAGPGAPYRLVAVNASGLPPGALGRLRPVLEGPFHVRHLGANALEMAMVAAGRLDACVDLRGRLRVQDLAAGCLLVREAGGVVLDAGMGELDSDLSYAARLSMMAAPSRGALERILAGDG